MKFSVTRRSILLLPAVILLLVSMGQTASSTRATVSVPSVVLTGIPFTMQVQLPVEKPVEDSLFYRVVEPNGKILAEGMAAVGQRQIEIAVKLNSAGKRNMTLWLDNEPLTFRLRVLPGWTSILPPLLAILLALITRQVIIALFFGIFLGVTFIYDFNPVMGFLHTLDHYIVQSLAEPDRVSILIFSMVLGGMVGVISRSGGTQGIVDKLTEKARSPRKAQLTTWALGVLIFFDDYANTLIVGNTMRPLTDKLRVSREKLSYLVDSTAAPVANIAIISTWIGYEISLINQSFAGLGISDNAYITFIKTIPYNFYPLLALWFGFMVSITGRDFGPMLKAERRARQRGAVLREGAMPLADLTDTEGLADENTPKRWYNAFIPIAAVIFGVCAGLVYTGWQAAPAFPTDAGWVEKISIIIGNADSFAVLMWASFFGSITAIVLAVAQRILSLQQAMEAWVKGIRSMVMAAIILTAAWTIGSICQELFTADYVIDLTRRFLTPHWLPLITFLTAAVVSFATGTSWGTMAILMPIAIPLAFKFPQAHEAITAAHATHLMLSTTAAVLAGATFGDHCSPISDTTIMSSMASGADHIDHVRTQLPYALTTGLTACVLGYIPVGWGASPFLPLTIGILVVFIIIRFVGQK